MFQRTVESQKYYEKIASARALREAQTQGITPSAVDPKKSKALEEALTKAEEQLKMCNDDVTQVRQWRKTYLQTQKDIIDIETVRDNTLRKEIAIILKDAGFTFVEHQAIELEEHEKIAEPEEDETTAEQKKHEMLLNNCWDENQLSLNASKKGLTQLSTSWINKNCDENLLKIDGSFNELTHVDTLDVNPVILDFSYNLLETTPDILTYQHASNLRFTFLDSNRITTCKLKDKLKKSETKVPKTTFITLENIISYGSPIPVPLAHLFTAKNLCLLSLSHNPTLQSLRVPKNFAGIVNLMHSLPDGRAGAELLQSYVHGRRKASNEIWPALPTPNHKRLIKFDEDYAQQYDQSYPDPKALIRKRSKLIKLATEMKSVGKACLIVTIKECYNASSTWSAFHAWYNQANVALPEEGPFLADQKWQNACGGNQHKMDTIRNYFHLIANHEIDQTDNSSKQMRKALAYNVCNIIDQINNDTTLFHECYQLIEELYNKRVSPQTKGNYFARCLVELQEIKMMIMMIEASRGDQPLLPLCEVIRKHMILKTLNEYIRKKLPEDLVEKYGEARVVNELILMYQNLLQEDDELDLLSILDCYDTDDQTSTDNTNDQKSIGETDDQGSIEETDDQDSIEETDTQSKRKPASLIGTLQSEYQIPHKNIIEIKFWLKFMLADRDLLTMELESNRFWLTAITRVLHENLKKSEQSYAESSTAVSTEQEPDDETDIANALRNLFGDQQQEAEEPTKEQIKELTMAVSTYYTPDTDKSKPSEWLNIEEKASKAVPNRIKHSPFI